MGKMSTSPKKIVYILGAGATQAEVSYKGGLPLNLMMKDSRKIGVGVSTRALGIAKIGRQKIRKVLDIKEEVDIEKLISLLSATSNKRENDIAEKLREAYYTEILKGLDSSDILNNPDLAIALLELHANEIFKKKELLSCIISLNHDNLFQIASQKVLKRINLGFNFNSSDFIDACTNKKSEVPLLVQLHGSFNWENSHPIKVFKLKRDQEYDADMLWIPPTILKETKDYPFNKLMGLSFEKLSRCDILRIIGCSLSQNDWNLISLIFNAQNKQYRTKKECFKVELIVDQEIGETVKKEYSYLKNITPIGYLKDGDFSNYLKKEKLPEPSALDNPFAFWLKTKSQFHHRGNELNLIDSSHSLKEIIGAS